MLNFALLASTPFKSKTSFEDLIGTAVLAYGPMIDAAFRLTGRTAKRVPIDAHAAPTDLLQAIQAQHNSIAQALQIPLSPDLQSYDLSKADDFASWTFLLSGDLTRLKVASGIV